MLYYSRKHPYFPIMSSKYYDFCGFNVDKALIDFNGDIEQVSLFALQNDERTEFLQAYREKIKEWLKFNHKNVKWLAERIGMSDGSAKNLLYSNMNITDKKLIAIQKAMDEGLESLEPSNLNWLVLRVYENINELADFAAWSTAAEIPFSCFIKHNMSESSRKNNGETSAENAEKLAAWATPVLMKEAASVLRHFYEQQRDALFPDIRERSATIRDIPHGYIPQFGMGFFIVLQDYEGSSFDYSDGQTYDEIQLPVIAEECQVVYIELAASLKKQSIEEWVITTLNKEARKRGLANLESFINSTLN